jgi:hypothetical protein
MISRRTSLLAAAAVPIAAVLTACSSSGSPMASGSATPAPATTGASSAPTALTSWYLTAIPPLHRINDAIVLAQHAAHRHDRAALHTACEALQRSVDNFSSVPAAPDREVRASLTKAMSHFDQAAGDCLSGDLTPAGFLVIQGQHAVRVAAHRVDALT